MSPTVYLILGCTLFSSFTSSQAEPNTTIYCDFKQDICEYSRRPTRLYAWFLIDANQTKEWPRSGCSDEGSQYMGLDGAQSGISSTAKLISPNVSGGDKCLQFCYYTPGTKGLSLNVYKSSDLKQAIWGPPDDAKGNIWHTAQVQIPSTSADYQIIFKGTRTGRQPRGSILGLDDIRACSSTTTPPTVPNSTFAAAPTTTAFTSASSFDNLSTSSPVSSELHCNFEGGMCNYTRKPMFLFSWTRQDTTNLNGPRSSCSLKGSHYVSLDAAQDGSSTEARLISPQLQRGDKCLQFCYYTSGTEKVSLKVLCNSNGTEQTIWSLPSGQHSMWHRTKVMIPEGFADYQVLVTFILKD
ncbi:MAM and LDL-receptor class A domain-containing protein 1-like [Watersipora subatra]|uniref:MAM and LDL-receptor class A domain-containing protein 1-like n=1 Tax=Watersipora subatra TaxID=2589382 RepID=UPI00355B74B3